MSVDATPGKYVRVWDDAKGAYVYREKDRTMSETGQTVRPRDPSTILAGIRQFGLAADGADLRDLENAITRLQQSNAALVEKANHEIEAAHKQSAALALENGKLRGIAEYAASQFDLHGNAMTAQHVRNRLAALANA